MRRARYLTTGFLALDPRAFGATFELPEPTAVLFETVGAVAVVRIFGPLEQHPQPFWQDYETIHGMALAAFESRCSAVALSINSPGGAAAGCFELARALRAMSEESGKPLGVFIDGQATSAAYALASAATPGLLHAPMTSTVASLAVYEQLVDQTAADAAMGVRFLFVPSSGADLKLTGNAHVAPSDVMVQHTQAQVDLLTSYFYGLIEEMRGIPDAEVQSLRGAALLASQGLDKGLVDEINDWAGFLSSLEAFKGPAKGTTKMPAQAKAKSPFSDALAALAAAAEGDDEEAASAKKMLAAHYGAEDDDSEDKDKPKESEAKAQEEPEKKEEPPKEEPKEEPPKEEPKAAMARAATGGSNELTLAQQVQTLLAERAQEKDAAARAALLGQRPDFSAEVRKTLATAPLPVVEQAVKNWPRVTASPQAAAAATTPAAMPGKLDSATHGALTQDERTILDNWVPKDPAAQARVDGTNLVLEPMTAEAARARLAEMAAQGLLPGGRPTDMARISNTEFKVSPGTK